MGSEYDIAQICVNGHIINDSSKKIPERNQKFCSKCGDATIRRCKSCNANIQGAFYNEGDEWGGGYFEERLKSPPAYCYNCGKAYSWTEMTLKAAEEMAKILENITTADRKILKQAALDLVKLEETPQVYASALKFKKIITKAGEDALTGYKNLFNNILSENLKKYIW